jgi:hypothetical protein
MSYADYFALGDYDRVQWVVFGGHLFVALLFVGGATQTLAGGGPLPTAGLQTVVALLVAGLGLTVAKVVGRR